MFYKCLAQCVAHIKSYYLIDLLTSHAYSYLISVLLRTRKNANQEKAEFHL